MIRHYAAAAQDAHAALFPAGLAWRYGLSHKLKLYGADGFHPSPVGTYLTALVVYAGLTGELPRIPKPVVRAAAAYAYR